MSVTVLAALLGAAAGVAAVPPERAAEIGAIFAEYEKPGSPGCAVGVVQDGALVFAEGYGLASVEWGIPNTPRTVFATASIAKQFTAAVVHLLAADGVLSLDDDVRKWIPELQDYGHRITLRHLIHHTSGLRDGVFGLVRPGDEEVISEADYLAMYSRQRGLQFTPGAEFAYNNTGYNLLAIVVKRASGRTLRQVAAERIFAPLGMADTLFLDDHAEVVARRASGYASAGEDRFRVDMGYEDLVGAGGVLTTVEDLARWQVNFETARVGGPALVEAMVRPGTLSDGTPLQYGSGLMLRTFAGHPTVRHRGTPSGFKSELMRFPDLKLHVICLCNFGGAPAPQLAERVAELWVGTESDPSAGAPPEPEGAVAARAGLFRDPATGMQVRLTASGSKLLLGAGAAARELWHVGGDEYLFPDRGWAARLVADGDRLQWFPVLGRAGTAERFEPARPSPAELRRIAGLYWSPELQVHWEISVEEGRPTLRIRSGPPRTMVPGVRGEFLSKGIVLRFEPGSRPAPGFEVFSGSVRGLPFERVRDRRAGPTSPPASSTRPR